MKPLLIAAACIGALTLTAGGAAVAQEPAKKAAPTKKAPAKKTTSKKAKAAAGAAAAAAVVPSGEKWTCELGNDLYISGNMQRDEIITMHWKGTDYRLPRQATVTGADRYHDMRTGMDLVVIPSKAMLFDRNAGQRLADDCQTADMQAGGSAPTQAGALRAPAATPLLVAPPAAPVAEPATAAGPAAVPQEGPKQ